MQAFILAAGKGERLLPFTHYVPKPLFHIVGQPLLGLLLDNLIKLGVSRIGLNAYHLAPQIRAFIKEYQALHPGVSLRIFEEPVLLGPLGGLRGAKDFFTTPTLVVNADIVTNFPFMTLWEAHQKNPAEVTMLLHHYPSFNNVMVQQDNVVGFSKTKGQYAYTGIQVVTPELVRSLGPEDRDLVPSYSKLLKKGFKIKALIATSFYWRDIGTLRSYLAVHEDILYRRAKIPGIKTPKSPFVYYVYPQKLHFEEWVFIEQGVSISPGTKLKKVVAWEGSTIPRGTHQEKLFIPHVTLHK